MIKSFTRQRRSRRNFQKKKNQNCASECNHGKGTQALLIRLEELRMPRPAQPLGDQP